MVSYFRVGMGSGLPWSGLIVSCHSRYENYVNIDFNFTITLYLDFLVSFVHIFYL